MKEITALVSWGLLVVGLLILAGNCVVGNIEYNTNAKDVAGILHVSSYYLAAITGGLLAVVGAIGAASVAFLLLFGKLK